MDEIERRERGFAPVCEEGESNTASPCVAAELPVGIGMAAVIFAGAAADRGAGSEGRTRTEMNEQKRKRW